MMDWVVISSSVAVVVLTWGIRGWWDTRRFAKELAIFVELVENSKREEKS